MLFETAGIVTVGSPTNDGGMRLRIETQEMTSEQKTALYDLHGKYGYIGIKPNQFQTSDIPMEDIEDKSKTPSKRLRAVLFLYHRQHGGKKETFEALYRGEMEIIIDNYKSKLD